MLVVYFDQLLGAVPTLKVVETFIRSIQLALDIVDGYNMHS